MRYHRSEAEIKERAARIKLLILDVDGVLTNGGLIIHHDGEESKIFSVRDGLAIRLLQRGGIEVALLTGRTSRVVARRAEELGIELVAQGSLNKLAGYEEMLRRRLLSEPDVAYVGDDLVDIPVLKRVGLAVAVADAATAVHSYCHLSTSSLGGRGAVREVCELLLQAQGKWEEVTGVYL
jgi:3-deoxy-D-manno-octulosonate 8-phosphate phosphatase (KDO 8-P phosphatase)